MTHKTELYNKWTQTAEVIMNIPGVGAVSFQSLIVASSYKKLKLLKTKATRRL